MGDVFIGVDIGTTNLKAVAFDDRGRTISSASFSTPTHYPQPGWAEYAADELWDAISSVIRKTVAGLETHVPCAIAFTGMAEAAFPLGRSGEALHSAISWFDRRVLPQMRAWETQIGPENTARITGLPIGPAAGVLRLLWLRDNKPRLFAKTALWLNLPDYSAYRLCGEVVTEHSLASRMMIFDVARGGWSKALLDANDISESLFGRLEPSGVQIGTVHADAATDTGLPIGLPVCTGGHDHLCAAAGLGATNFGDVFDSIGTAEALIASLPPAPTTPEAAVSGVAHGLHVVSSAHYAITGNAYGGGSIEWARQVLLPDVLEADTAFKLLIERAENAEPGSGGVMFLPHLRGGNPPHLDALSRSAFVGMTSDTTADQMSRAVLEGLAFEFQNLIETVQTRFGIHSERLVAAGGGTRNRAFMQIKADVSGLEVHVPLIEEATCLGAAVAAGIGVGAFNNYAHANGQFTLSPQIFTPNRQNHENYARMHETVYTPIYSALRPLNHTISDWAGESTRRKATT